MREILFRGKRSDGKWAFGSLMKVTYDGTTYNLIFADNFLFVFGQATAMEHAAVILETVGQFTGLTDKSDVKIFEQDICRFDDELMVVEWHDEDSMFFLRSLDGTNWTTNFSMVAGKELEVIGNIHDNLELLEVGVDAPD